MRKVTLILVAIGLSACNTTTTGTPTLAGQDKYIVTSMGNLFPTGHEPVLEDAIKKGAALCKRQGKSIEVTDTYQNSGPYVMGNYPKATVTFKCVE
jgi:hypothetical protein